VTAQAANSPSATIADAMELVTVVGWGIWACVMILAVSWTSGCRIYAHRAEGVSILTLHQTLSFWILGFLFYITDWSKLHVLWAAPTAYISSYLLLHPRFLPSLGFFGFPARLFGHIVSFRVASPGRHTE
jgi:hypothetical protein